MAKKKKFRLTRSTRNQLLETLQAGHWPPAGAVKPTLGLPLAHESAAVRDSREASLPTTWITDDHQLYLKELKKIGAVIGVLILLLIALKIADQLTGTAERFGRRLAQTIGITAAP